MSDRPLKLILIDNDPVFKLGLTIALQQFTDIQIVAEADTEAVALQTIASFAGTNDAIDIVILELYLEYSQPERSLGLNLCQQLKNQYPYLPILLLSSRPTFSHLAAARQLGVNGYCPKGTSISVLVRAIRQIVSGQSYWSETFSQNLSPSVSTTSLNTQQDLSIVTSKNTGFLSRIRQDIRQSGLQQINATLSEIEDLLQNVNLSSLDILLLAGRRRELLASRWLIDKLMSTSRNKEKAENQESANIDSFASSAVQSATAASSRDAVAFTSPSLTISNNTQQVSTLSFTSQETSFFEIIWQRLNSSLQNLTRDILEIDILRYQKKRELLYLCLRKFEDILDELRLSQIQPEQIYLKYPIILRNLWQEVIIEFFGKYYTITIGNFEIEVVDILLKDAEVVQNSLLKKIPFVAELLVYLLFEAPLNIDNASYEYQTPEAKARAEILLQNLLIQLANSIVQPLLNNFANIEEIKQNFYDRSLMSSREIASFRNNLSWRYRLDTSIYEPINVFESRLKLYVFSAEGIRKKYIYASRYQELEQLPFWQLVVTLIIEIRDAIAPRFRAVITLLGKGVVYLLTQVVGRGIGLVGKGIIQGLGNALQEKKYK